MKSKGKIIIFIGRFGSLLILPFCFVAPIIACFLCGERRDPSQLILEPNKIRWGLGQAEAGTGAGLLPLPVIPPTF